MNNDRINILWTTDNKDTVFNMIIMYATNAITCNWWKHVNIIIWGASAKLVGNDTQIQTEIMEMIHLGISIEACKDCSNNFGISEKLEKLGVTVRYMGEPLTEYIKAGEKVISI